MIIGIDFDGTCVTHDFPSIGQSIGAEEVLIDLVKEGHSLILFTMRSDKQGDIQTKSGEIIRLETSMLHDAVNWFNEREIPLWGVNENPEQKSWTNSPKPYCHLYIDDAALGCPVKYDKDISDRPFVDWKRVEALLTKKGYLNNKQVDIKREAENFIE